jgi:hypothetical protein
MTDTPAGRTPPASRYGRAPMSPATRRRMVLALGTIPVLLGLGFAVGAYQRFEMAPVEGEMVAYDVLDEQTASVTITVTRKDPAVPVVCIVRARGRDGGEAGRREILVGPSTERTVQVTTTVKTFKRPYVGDIYGCGTAVPPYLTAP